MPTLLVIDGGQGQLTQAQAVLEELAVNSVMILGIAKGTSRKPGLEQLMLAAPQRTFMLDTDHLGLRLLQQIRDEAHRFAIVGHRAQRDKKRRQSVLETIPGIGAKRRRTLLHHFGGLAALKQASMEDLSRVPGISLSLAQKIYHELRHRG